MNLWLYSGWWFGTWLDSEFPYIGNNHPNWRAYFSEGWVNHQPLVTNQWLSWFSNPKQANGLKLRDFKEVDGHMMSCSKSQPWRPWLDIHDIEESSLPGVRRCLVFTVNEGLEINPIYQAFGQIICLTGNIYEHDYHFLTSNQCI